MAKTAENLLKLNPSNEVQPDSLDQVRDILVGALVNRIESAVAGLEERQALQNEALLNELAEQRKAISSLERTTTKLKDDLKEQLKDVRAVQTTTKRDVVKLEKSHSEVSGSHDTELQSLENGINDVYEELKTLIHKNTEEIETRITSNTKKLESSKVERNDLSSMLSNIATMIGNEKPGSKA